MNSSDQQKDPVCGMSVDPKKSAGSSLYKGTTYYFCNPRCKARFDATPEAFLSPSKAPTKPVAPGVEYTCPMHPEVRQIGPGTCPKCGMALEPAEVSLQDAPDAEYLDMRHRFLWSLPFTGILLILAMSNLLHGTTGNLVQLSLCLVPFFYSGWPLLVRGWKSFQHLRLNMFSLIALGTTSAFLFSVASTLFPGLIPAAFFMHGVPPVYFESAAAILTLVLLGQVLELRARQRTSGALKDLLQLAPTKARKVFSMGREEDVELAAVMVGDILRVRPGEKVPVDGRITEGTSYVDESMVTGEATPSHKVIESSVTGGTLNGEGTFLMRAEKVGDQTLLAQIVRTVSEAQRSKAPIAELADTVSAWFVPAVIVSALITAVAWFYLGPEPRAAHALINAVAVLIIACPCALGLATPMSIMVAMGRAAKSGILIRNAQSLQRLEKVNMIVFDKTGTLTLGSPEVIEIQPIGPNNVSDILRVAAAVERGSEHPLATAILRRAKKDKVEIPASTSFESLRGRGAKAVVEDRQILVGNEQILKDHGIDGQKESAVVDTWRRQGKIAVYVARDQSIIGILAIADPIKPSALAALTSLKRQNIQLALLTGDHKLTAQFVASELGIETVFAEVLPTDKHEVIRSLQSKGQIVAMVGDGVNDAPALAKADVGIAMGSGTDIAIQSAGIVMMGGDLQTILRTRRLSEVTMKNIRQNLVFAFAYNLLGVPIAAGLLYPFFGLLLSPMFASAAMSLSSVSVISNALRLRHAKISDSPHGFESAGPV